MLLSALHRGLLFGYVLMDSWYATAEFMRLIISKNKVFCCPIKSSRKVDDSDAERPYQDVNKLDWSWTERKKGKLVKLNKFPLDVRVRLLRPGRRSVEVSTDRTEWLITNSLSQDSTQAAHEESSLRWKMTGPPLRFVR